jgi:hypothetical protein
MMELITAGDLGNNFYVAHGNLPTVVFLQLGIEV